MDGEYVFQSKDALLTPEEHTLASNKAKVRESIHAVLQWITAKVSSGLLDGGSFWMSGCLAPSERFIYLIGLFPQ